MQTPPRSSALTLALQEQKQRDQVTPYRLPLSAKNVLGLTSNETAARVISTPASRRPVDAEPPSSPISQQDRQMYSRIAYNTARKSHAKKAAKNSLWNGTVAAGIAVAGGLLLSGPVGWVIAGLFALGSCCCWGNAIYCYRQSQINSPISVMTTPARRPESTTSTTHVLSRVGGSSSLQQSLLTDPIRPISFARSPSLNSVHAGSVEMRGQHAEFGSSVDENADDYRPLIGTPPSPTR